VRPHQSALDPLFGAQGGDGFARQRDCPAIGREKAGQEVDERRFAGAVGPDQRDARARHEVEVDPLGGDHRTEAFRETANRQGGH
jgi:hypothetical protein